MSEDRVEEAESKDTEQREHNDRKRKRSPSLIVVCEKSPTPVTSENEPDIDSTIVALSWYDSDLNLVIDTDGFFSATPMYNEGFCYMWAGVRGSHGFKRGKVYYETKITKLCPVDLPEEEQPYLLRLGWSASYTSLQLGEQKLSYGYDGTGKKSTDNTFTEYGPQFGKDDVIGCYLDATSDDSIVLSYTVNGKNLGAAFNVSKDEIGDRALFPHIMSKNCTFACNFGQNEPWSEQISDSFIPLNTVDLEDRVHGPHRPERKEDCEVIMMCGLPGAGKTFWATKHATEHPEKMYNMLGVSSLIDKMKNTELPFKQSYRGRWEVLIDKCTRALDKLLDVAPTRRRNYILDQANVYPSAQKRKMKNFSGYQRKAVVVVPSEEEFKSRTAKHESLEGISDSSIMEMKATFSVPVVGKLFDVVEWAELNEEESKKVIEKYNKEGKDAGYSSQQQQHQSNKRPRFENNRNNRDNRDYRRMNYQDRNRIPTWRGAGNMGWRERPPRGHIRHAGGYGPPPMGGWRGRAPMPPPHRAMADRRGDRRVGNDRNRPVAPPRQGGWGPMNNYQGSQSGWGQQGNWSNSQSQQGSWGQQGGWGQQQQQQQWGGGWKSYGQGSYGQSNYNQQGYGNGNWNSWNQQQYYNQYWGQQQQAGQTTAAGGQAASTTESVTAAPNSNSEATYSYTQDWQGFSQGSSYPAGNTVTSVREHK